MPPHLRTASPQPSRSGRNAAQHVARAARATAREPFGVPMFMLVGLWVIQIFDVQWLIAAHGPDVVLKSAVLLLGGLLAVLAVGVPSNIEWRRRWQWNAPFLMLILIGYATLPFVANKTDARMTLQVLLIWWTLIVGTVALIGSVRRVEMLLVMYGVQFLWVAVWGLPAGLVSWHPTLSNHDGYGALLVGGIAMCYFLALATPHKWLKRVMYLAAGLSAVGVVASFARGAFLATVVVFSVVVMRSPNKWKTTAAAIAAVAVVCIAATVMFEEGAFWAEIMSSFDEGTTEGTGEDRWILWGAAWQVFLEKPILGAGVRNWGAVAATLFQHGELGGQYTNPGALYNMALHNMYMTTLSEQGALGVFALVWLLVDFFKRNAALRTPRAERAWREGGARLALRPVSLGLEAAMVGFLCCAALYSMMVIHWFYTMIALNLVLHSVTVRLSGAAAAVPRRRVHRVVPAAPDVPVNGSISPLR